MTPIESWEKEFDKEFPYIDGNNAFGELDGVKAFIRTKLDEAYRKGREDALKGPDPDTLKRWGFPTLAKLLRQEARHAGEVSKEVT